MLGRRIRWFRECKRISQSELEKRTGIKREYLSKMENEDLKNPTYFTLLKIANGLGIEITELMEAPEVSRDRHEPVVEIVSSLKRDRQLRDRVESGQYMAIPIIAGEIAAGSPTYVDGRQIEDYALVFARSVKSTTDPYRYRCIWVRKGSRSMSPVIEPGSLVCIDSYQRTPAKLVGKIVALRDEDGGCTIRYLRIENNYLIGMPENIKEYNPLVLQFSGKRMSDRNPLIGKVIWYWKSLED